MKMSVHTSKKFLGLLALCGVALSLSACGGAKEMLGLEKSAPDEFAVYSRAPLSLPPDYALKPPKPGAERPQSVDESTKARSALVGKKVLPTKSTAEYQHMSSATQALLKQTGALNADDSIRKTIDRETSAFIEESKSFTDDIMFWKEQKAFGTKVDAVKEAKRIRDAQALGEKVDGTGSVVIERKDEAILEGIFN